MADDSRAVLFGLRLHGDTEERQKAGHKGGHDQSGSPGSVPGLGGCHFADCLSRPAAVRREPVANQAEHQIPTPENRQEYAKLR